jgi:hypothetical protein
MTPAVIGTHSYEIAQRVADLHALADELDRLGKLADQVETQPGPLDEDWNERRKDEGRAAPQNDRREVAHGSGEAPGASGRQAGSVQG